MIFEWIQAQAIKLLGGALALSLVAIPINGCVQYNRGENAGREEIRAELRAAERKAMQDAWEARAKADEKARERAKARREALREQLDTIEKAEADEKNPLDSLF
jgi:hypothetical protein